MLITTPVLHFLNFNYTFLMDVDANGGGLGAVLRQNIDDQEVIAYASRTLMRKLILCYQKRNVRACMGHLVLQTIFIWSFISNLF